MSSTMKGGRRHHKRSAHKKSHKKHTRKHRTRRHRGGSNYAPVTNAMNSATTGGSRRHKKRHHKRSAHKKSHRKRTRKHRTRKHRGGWSPQGFYGGESPNAAITRLQGQGLQGGRRHKRHHKRSAHKKSHRKRSRRQRGGGCPSNLHDVGGQCYPDASGGVA